MRRRVAAWRPGISNMIDNRGREVPLCRRSSLRPDVPSRARAALARADLASGRYIVSILIGVTSIAVVPVTTTLMFDWPPWRERWPAVLIAAFAIPLFVALYFRVRIGQPGFEENAREAMLAACLCPSCALELHAGVVESDGCTVCPECGAAWRLSMQIVYPNPR